MSTQTLSGVGTIFKRWNGATWDDIAEVRAIVGPSASKDTIDVTSFQSLDGTREFTGGF